MGSDGLGDFVEFARTLSWYAGRKATLAGLVFETGKGVIVEILKARRGTYQKPFLHVGMVFLVIAAALSAPVIANQYPTSAFSESVNLATPPSAVLNAATDISNVDTVTLESEKPRRDVIDYTVQGGDTLSSIAAKFSSSNNKVDSASIAYLNKIAENKLLQPGQVIKIPPVSGIIVTVKSGDTIQSLAKKYGLASAQPIVDWPYNSFANDETFALSIGQTLVIPNGRPPEEVPVAPVIIRQLPLFAPPTGGGQFAWPTGGTITQNMSWYHHGIDIANSFGTPIAAADSGRVVSVQYLNWGYGYYVTLDHGNGFRTLYAHLSKILVAEGDNVSRTQVIALMGSTGRSTGSHLHFEIHENGNPLNPLSFLQ